MNEVTPAVESTMEMAERIELWPLDDLVPYDKNPRTHSSAQIEKLAGLITQFGFTQPILVDAAAGIIAGHGRLLAARLLHMDRVPVIVLTHLSEAQKLAYIIADNRIALDAGWDDALLAGALETLQDADFDLALTGFGSEEIDQLLADDAGAGGGGGDPDAAPSTPVMAVTQTGDVWTLGSHRLVCGDCLDFANFERLLGAERVALVWTDPPYNVDYTGKTADALQLQGDSMGDEEFLQFLKDALNGVHAHMADGAGIYMAFAETKGVAFRVAFLEAGFHLASCLIWRKNVLVLGHADYHYQHEPILYGWRQGAGHSWYGNRDKTTIVELGDPLFVQTADDEWQITLGEQTLIIRGAGATVEYAHGSVFFEEKPSRNAEHPTMKPVALIERMLVNSSKRGDLVLDPFGGSGSTLIACEKIKRRARLLEIDPRYCDVIVQRWQEYTGQAALLHSTGKSFAETSATRSSS